MFMQALKLFLLILLSLIAGCKDSNTTTATLTEGEVLAFVNAYDEAWNSKKNKTVDSLYASIYQYFTSVGGISSRARNLEILTANYYKLNNAERSEIVISIEGNTAIVSSRWQGSGLWRGETFNDNQRCGLVIQKQGKALKLLSEHCVDIAAEPSL